MPTVEGLPESPESIIVDTFYDLIAQDSWLNTTFDPIVLIEGADKNAFKGFYAGALTVVPLAVRTKDNASDRQTVSVDIIIGAYRTAEPADERSELFGLRLGNHLRKLVYSNNGLIDATVDPPQTVTFATAGFSFLAVVEPKEDSGTRIFFYKVTFETDLFPQTGLFA